VKERQATIAEPAHRDHEEHDRDACERGDVRAGAARRRQIERAERELVEVVRRPHRRGDLDRLRQELQRHPQTGQERHR
jgi:hypothetical protein